MKISEFKLNRLNDFVKEKEIELIDTPFLRSPFGMSTEGNIIGAWQMNFNRIEIFSSSYGKNLFGKNDMIIITVPATESGIHPLIENPSFGWDGKINEDTAEMAVCVAFELISDNETKEFLKAHKPAVDFSYIDSDGPGEINVKYNGDFWIITG